MSNAIAFPASDMLERILRAPVYDVAKETPLQAAPGLSQRSDNHILLKREDLQPTFSFKVRGAYACMAALPPAVRARGVVAASAGNHAQGVAMAARHLGTQATLVMPQGTPDLKIRAVRDRGGHVVVVGTTFDEAAAHAHGLAEQRGLAFVHPFDDPDVIAGQGTVGVEILRQHPGPLHAIFVAIGGGGLAAGIAAYVKRVRPEVRVIGVEPVNADAMRRSLHAGKRVMLKQVGRFADGVAVKQVGQRTFELCQEFLDDVVLIDDDQICVAMKEVFDDTRVVLEPAGALAVAGARRYAADHHLVDETLVAVASGANLDFTQLQWVAQRVAASPPPGTTARLTG